MFDLSCLLACRAMAGEMEYVTQAADPSDANIAKYFPLAVVAIIIYFLFFHKKKK